MPAYLDEVFSPFCQQLPTPPPPPAFGQLYWAHVYYPHARLQVWRPKVLDQKTGIANDFTVQSPADAFKRKLPLSAPHLATNEEFVVIRAKKRPVILIQPPDPKLATVNRVVGGAKLARNLAPIAPLFSVVDPTGAAKVDAVFLERVRTLVYPQFLFFPSGGPLSLDSLARFDEIQSADVAHLQPTGFMLNEDVTAILKSQLCFFLTGLTGKEFLDWASELQK